MNVSTIVTGTEAEAVFAAREQAADGKFYLTDAADTEQHLRLIQSIPSPKTEPS